MTEMLVRSFSLLCALLVFAPWSVNADPLAGGLARYRAGAFIQAADYASQLETAPGSALAARALLVEAAHRATGERAAALLDKALGYTADALERDPRNVEAMLYRVIGLGYLSRKAGNLEAHSAGWGKEAKALWERAELLEPDDAWVHAVKCGWHAEVADEAGSILASFVYGASGKRAIEACQRAVQLAPNDPVVRVEFARSMLRLSIRKYADEASHQLRLGVQLKPQDMFQRLIIAQGRALLTALQAGDRKEVRRVFIELDAFRD